MEKEKNIVIEDNKLTDEQAEAIAKDLQEVVKENENLSNIAQFPSNNGVQETDPETREEGTSKRMMVSSDPTTGEQRILGEAVGDIETFEEMCERIQNQEIQLDKSPITEKEIIEKISVGDKNDSMLAEIVNQTELSSEAVHDLLNIVNRKMKGESFNIYQAFPNDIKKMVDKYMTNGGIPIGSKEGRRFRNSICELLISDFIKDISVDRTMSEFNKEVETLFQKGSEEITDAIVGYTKERNDKYREYAENMEDPEKKAKVLEILDAIDEGYNLTKLKEFAKTCKIKRFDLEKPQRHYQSFLSKYANSTYNIYHIDNCRQILFRNLNVLYPNEYSVKDIDAFFVAFCYQTRNFKPDVAVEHAYMFYTLCNVMLIDANKGEERHISETFMENIKEVISNLRERNHNFN